MFAAYDKSDNGDGRILAVGETAADAERWAVLAGCEPEGMATCEITDALAAYVSAGGESWRWLPGQGMIGCTPEEAEAVEETLEEFEARLLDEESERRIAEEAARAAVAQAEDDEAAYRDREREDAEREASIEDAD